MTAEAILESRTHEQPSQKKIIQSGTIGFYTTRRDIPDLKNVKRLIQLNALEGNNVCFEAVVSRDFQVNLSLYGAFEFNSKISGRLLVPSSFLFLFSLERIFYLANPIQAIHDSRKLYVTKTKGVAVMSLNRIRTTLSNVINMWRRKYTWS